MILIADMKLFLAIVAAILVGMHATPFLQMEQAPGQRMRQLIVQQSAESH